MSAQKYVEIVCDNCGQANHAHGGDVHFAKRQMRELGLVFSKLGDFCCKECFDEFKKEDK